jgi:carbamoyltransferase
VQPAAGDAGGSLGAALALWHIEQNNPRKVNPNDDMQGSYLGPEYSQKKIQNQLDKIGAVYEIKNEEDLLNQTADDLSKGQAIGWFQGRAEFGPRALGNRSILGDPRSSEMQKNLNLKVKYRESFRPFAPSILKEDLAEWFNITEDSPYMLMVANINKEKTIKMTEDQKKLFGIDKLNIKRSEIPAVTHVDYSARIQTVYKETNSKYYKLIKKFKEKPNCPVILNTSFNVRGEPMVNTPTDAFNCFMGTELEKLVIGNCYLEKKLQNTSLKKDYKIEFNSD